MNKNKSILIENEEKIKKVIEFLNIINNKVELAGKNVTFCPNDKIFVYKNCKFKKLPLNKLIKDKKIPGVARTYKIEEATVIVMPEVYSYPYFGKEIEYKTIVGLLSRWEFRRKIYEKYKTELNLKGICSWELKLEQALALLKEKNDSFLITTILKVNENYSAIKIEHLEYMIKSNVKVIHEDSVQQIVYGILNPVKELVGEYNIDAILELLGSSDYNNHVIATEILKNTNIEEDYYTLLKEYKSNKWSDHAKMKFYVNIIRLNPKLKKLIGSPKWNTISRIHEFLSFIKTLKELEVKINPLVVYENFFKDYSKMKEVGECHYFLSSIYDVKKFLGTCEFLGVPIDPEVFMKKMFNLTKKNKQCLNQENEKKENLSQEK